MIVIRKASFSRCKQYRYELQRIFDEGQGVCVFIGLNPSTADARMDDPTIRRCMGFARDWGYRQLRVVNLFAYRTTYPDELKRCSEPVGKGNRRAIRRACAGADCIVAAWGMHGTLHDQDRRLIHSLSDWRLECFGLTRNGRPLHPLYLRRDAVLVPFAPPADPGGMAC